MQFRPITNKDILAFHELVKENRDHLLDYFPKTVMAAKSPETAGMMIDNYIEKTNSNELFVFVAEDAEAGLPEGQGKLSGIFFLKEIIPYHSKCEIAYFVDRAHQRKGIATEGIQHLIRFAFEELKLNKVYCRIATDNYSSVRAAEKNNFVPEGSLQKEFKMSSGKFVDVYYMGLLNPNSK